MSDRYLSMPVGYARVNREPLDKYEQFNSLREAIKYAASGASYTGQQVKVVFDSTKTNDNNYALYTVNKDRKLDPVSLNNAFTSFGCNELNILTNGVIKWVLLYYHDSKAVYSDDTTLGNSIGNPYKYSILNELELFRNTNDEFNFLLYKNDEENKWRQRTNPISNEIVGSASDDGVVISGNITKLIKGADEDAYIKDTVNAKYVSIMPKIASTDVVELYVDATEYLSGGDF